MEFIQLEKNMREAVNKIEEIGSQLATAKGISYQMQKQREVVLAKLAKNFVGSMASREMEAKATDRYMEHIIGTGEAIEIEARLKAQYCRWQAQYESCRSLLSMEKAKTNIR